MYWQANLCRRTTRKNRAEYGAYITKYLSEQLLPKFRSGFGVRYLELMRQFYRIFPIANSLRSQLSWSQYKLLLTDIPAKERFNRRII